MNLNMTSLKENHLTDCNAKVQLLWCCALQVWPKLWASAWLTWWPLGWVEYTAGYVCVGVFRRTGPWRRWHSQWLTPLKDWTLDRIQGGVETVEMRWFGGMGHWDMLWRVYLSQAGSIDHLWFLPMMIWPCLLHHALSSWSCLRQI